MFSSSFSLRQNIREVDTDLYNYKVSNNGRVDALESFKSGLEETGEGSIQDLQDKHDAQATLISTLETNADALQTRINTFNASLEDGSDGVLSTIEQIELNRVEVVRLDNEIIFEAEARTDADTALGVRIDYETLARSNAIIIEQKARVDGDNEERDARSAAINQEVADRDAAILVETNNRVAADDAEILTREAAINKFGFMVVSEAEGVFTVGSSPFCFGMGNQSEAGYGLYIPFAYNLYRVALTGITTDTSPDSTLKLTHYPLVGDPAVLDNAIVGATLISNHVVLSAPSEGNLVAEVVSVAGMTDENANFRMTLAFTSNDQWAF